MSKLKLLSACCMLAAIGLTSASAAITSPAYVDPQAGVDSGLCPQTAPCLTLNYALSQIATNGNVIVMRAGIFGPIRLTSSVSISGYTPDVAIQIEADSSASPGCIGGAPGTCGANSNYAVEVNISTTSSVKLGHVAMLQGGSGGIGALLFSSGGYLQMSGCVFRGNGSATLPIVMLAPNSGTTNQAQVYLSNSDIGWTNGNSANAGAVLVLPVGTTSMAMHFNHVEVHNASYGIRVDGSSLTTPSANIAVAITESEFFSFPNAAMNVFSTSGTGTVHGLFANVNVLNAGAGVKANGLQSFAVFSLSNIVGNQTGVLLQNGGTFVSSQNNTIQGNAVNLNTAGGTYTNGGTQ